MARHHGGQPPQNIGWAGLALLAVLLMITALIWTGWRSGLLAVTPGDIVVRLRAAPSLPRLPRVPMPDPQPAPLPRPGPRAET